MDKKNNLTKRMLSFIDSSPTSFHVVDNLSRDLLKRGFTELSESSEWKLAPGDYFVRRNDSAIISFRIPKKSFKGFHMIASHSDSPTFKIKENPEMKAGAYIKLNVEKYGGMLCAEWFDRPLSVAGRVVVNNKGKAETRLVNIDRDLLMLPALAIHMNREANDGMKYNAQNDMLPIFGDAQAAESFFALIAMEAGVRKKEDILGHDLFLYNRVAPTFWGANEEFIASARLDDQECVYCSYEGFVNSKSKDYVAMHCVFDNEEVGSGTKQGADSTFLKDTVERICDGLGRTREQYHMAVANSFMISADNAHAVHPNYSDKADPVNRPVMNGGIVIKYNANQKYTTDAVSAAEFKLMCKEADVPFQIFTNRSDMPGGSTLGNISTAQVSVNTVDIGLAQLAMHSPYESAGSKDPEYLAAVSKVFYNK